MGVGNPLMRDDGIGPRVIEMLRSGYTFPDNVEVVDAGTMSFMILDLLRGVDHLIIIDAMQDTEYPPGTVLRMTPEEIAPNQVAHSLHDLRLVDVLQAAELMGSTPQTIAFGVQIESIEEWVLELSAPVDARGPHRGGRRARRAQDARHRAARLRGRSTSTRRSSAPCGPTLRCPTRRPTARSPARHAEPSRDLAQRPRDAIGRCPPRRGPHGRTGLAQSPTTGSRVRRA